MFFVASQLTCSRRVRGPRFGCCAHSGRGLWRDSEAAGLYGFSAVLTSVAVGSLFYSPSLRVAIYVLFGVVFTVITHSRHAERPAATGGYSDAHRAL